MGDSSGKKAASDLLVKRKVSGAVSRDTPNGRNQKVQFCNRIGCNGRMNSTTRGIPFGGPEKLKPLRPSFRSSSGKEMIGSCSRTSSLQSSLRKPLKEPQNNPSVQPEMGSSVCTSDDHDIESGVHLNPKSSKGIESTSNKPGSSSVESVPRKHCNLIKKSGLGKQCTLPGPSVSLEPKSTNLKRNGLRNLRCNSMSDAAVRSGSSSSELSQNRQKIAVAKKTSVAESSSFLKGKKRIEPSVQLQSSSPKNGVFISDSRRHRSLSFSNGDSGTRRPVNSASRERLSNQGNANHFSHNESPIMIRQKAESEASASSSLHQVSSHQISSKNRTRIINSYSRPNSSTSGSLQSRVPGSFSEGLTHTLMNRDSFQRRNMNGIAEVLLALEGIEQDEELSYEQLLVLETNLFLNGLSFHDQHRDMRLDIDNMSYEELLALEEKMGTVSTALTEDALEECITSSIYETKPPEALPSDTDVDNKSDDVKCSICQEEYVEGDKLGRLQCEHNYHLTCAQQWLRLKNWCPVCKNSAATSLS